MNDSYWASIAVLAFFWGVALGMTLAILLH